VSQKVGARLQGLRNLDAAPLARLGDGTSSEVPVTVPAGLVDLEPDGFAAVQNIIFTAIRTARQVGQSGALVRFGEILPALQVKGRLLRAV
jgi:hypothetical protein